jgi:hypothetical protein
MLWRGTLTPPSFRSGVRAPLTNCNCKPSLPRLGESLFVLSGVTSRQQLMSGGNSLHQLQSFSSEITSPLKGRVFVGTGIVVPSRAGKIRSRDFLP